MVYDASDCAEVGALKLEGSEEFESRNITTKPTCCGYEIVRKVFEMLGMNCEGFILCVIARLTGTDENIRIRIPIRMIG